jgi:hypothetical protein
MRKAQAVFLPKARTGETLVRPWAIEASRPPRESLDMRATTKWSGGNHMPRRLTLWIPAEDEQGRTIRAAAVLYEEDVIEFVEAAKAAAAWLEEPYPDATVSRETSKEEA